MKKVENKLVTVVVPVFNTAPDDLYRCISSILAIKRRDIELIVVNDGSALKYSAAYEAHIQGLGDDRVSYVYQDNMGVSAARNLGISLASGKYIMLVDSDDEIIPEVFEVEYDAELVIFPFLFIKGRRKKCITGSAVGGDSRTVPFEELAWSSFSGRLRGSCGILYQRVFLMKHGIKYEEGVIQGEDADFNHRVIMARPRTQYIRKASYIYHFSTDTAYSRWEKMPDKMISSGNARFEWVLASLPAFFPDDCESRKNELIRDRIHEVYRCGIDLCGTNHATDERKREIERLMRSITLPEAADRKTRCRYLDIINRRWGRIQLIAMLRRAYLFVTGI